MSPHARLRTPNPHLGAYFGIVTSAFISLVLVLAMFEELGWQDATLGQVMLFAPLLLYLLIAFGARTLDPQDFYASGRRVPPLFNGAVLAATAIGGAGLLGYIGAIFFLGFDALAIGLGWSLGMLAATVLFVPYLHKAGAFTLPGFLGHRFRSRLLRIAGSLLQLPPAWLLLAAEIKIAALIAAAFMPISFPIAVLLITAIVASTAILGGIRALTWSGSAEFIMAALGLAVPLIVISILLTNLPAPQLTYGEELSSLQNVEVRAGLSSTMPGSVGAIAPEEAPAPVMKALLQPFGALGCMQFLAVFLCLAFGTAALPSLLMRSGVANSITDQRRSSAWGLFFVALFAITAPAIAVFAKLIVFRDVVQGSSLPSWLTELSGRHLMQAGDANGDGLIGASELLVARDGVALALPTAAGLPYVLTVLLAAGAMAIALAAAGSHLFTLASSLAEDLYRSLDRRPGALPRLAAAWAAIAASALAAAVFLLIADLDPFRSALTAFGLAGATFFPVLLLSIWWPGMTERGALAALGTGFAVGVFAILAGGGLGAGSLTAMASLLAIVLAIGAGLAVSLYAGPRAARIERIYFEDMRDPAGEAIYDRAQARAAAAADAASAASTTQGKEAA